MISRGAPEFWQRYRELPPEIQAATRKAYRLFNRDPAHPSLRLERLRSDPRAWSVRLKAEGSYDLRPRLKAITAPVLLLQGPGKIRLAAALLGQTSEQGYPACDFTRGFASRKETWYSVPFVGAAKF